MDTFIRCRVLRHLIWFITVFLCPTKWTIRVYELRIINCFAENLITHYMNYQSLSVEIHDCYGTGMLISETHKNVI